MCGSVTKCIVSDTFCFPVKKPKKLMVLRNRALAARGSARGRPASQSGPRTSTTLRAVDGAPDLAAQEPGTSSGSLKGP